MPANLENSAVITRLEKISFHPNPKRRAVLKNVQATRQLSSFHILVRLYSKSFKVGFSSMCMENFQMYRLGIEEAEKPEIKFSTSI